ncbi:MAG: trigger factor [Rickettsiales bacterium]|jgi:trigger factor|nr:trigger factor [Rickettsiales bacterium]
MNSVKDKIKGLKYELTITIPYTDFEKKVETKIMEYAKTAKIQGFRAGHAPITVIKQKYGNAFDSDALNDAMNDAVFGYVEQNKLKLADQPKVDMDKFEPGKDIKFTATFEVFPKIENINLEKISATKKVLLPTEKDVDDALKELAQSRHESIKIETPRPSQKDDIVVIDFEGFIDGKPFDGGKGSKYSLQLGSKSFIEGFEDQLIGKNTGDETDVNVKFPKDYHVADLANKPAIFKVKIIDIRERKIPEINDELAVAVGRKDLAELKEQIKQMQTEHWNDLSKNGMRDEVFGTFSKMKIDIPESLIERELSYMKQSEKIDDKDEKKIKSLKEEAEKRVKLSLILNQIGADAEIKIDDADIQKALMTEVQRYPQNPQQVIEYYTKNAGAMNMLKAQIYEVKVLDYIFGKIKITEKKVSKKEDLM